MIRLRRSLVAVETLVVAVRPAPGIQVRLRAHTTAVPRAVMTRVRPVAVRVSTNGYRDRTEPQGTTHRRTGDRWFRRIHDHSN